MTDHPAALSPEIKALFAEAEAILEAMARSTDRLEALAAEMQEMADTIDAGMADATAELQEWT
jgi:hypothetical protein